MKLRNFLGFPTLFLPSFLPTPTTIHPPRIDCTSLPTFFFSLSASAILRSARLLFRLVILHFLHLFPCLNHREGGLGRLLLTAQRIPSMTFTCAGQPTDILHPHLIYVYIPHRCRELLAQVGRVDAWVPAEDNLLLLREYNISYAYTDAGD